MNFSPPKFVLDVATEALNTVQGNHYAHPKGHVRPMAHSSPRIC
jgi:kynurenine aminotransferase